MVKSVLNKFLEWEDYAKSVSDVTDFADKTCAPISSVDNVLVCGYEDDRVSDEDGLVIKAISHPGNGIFLLKDTGTGTRIAWKQKIDACVCQKEESICIHG